MFPNKTQWAEEREQKLQTLKGQIQFLEDEMKLYTAPYHLNQKRRAETAQALLQDQLRRLQENQQWTTMEQQSETYIDLLEQQQLLEKLEKKAGTAAAGATGAGTEATDFCLARLKGCAPAIQLKTVPVCETPSCREQVLTYDSIHSTLNCGLCGRTKPFIDATSNLTAYGDEVEIVNFSYKRVSHFKDQLHFVQGKETTRIQESVIQQICTCLREQYGFQTKQYIKIEDVSKAMKTLGLRKYYKNKVQIHGRITGIPPARLTPAQEQQFLHFFRQMQPIFEKRCPQNRSSFLPYKMVAHRFCEYFDLPEFKKLFPLPKSSKKLKEFDTVFRQIAEDLGWDVKKFNLTC
jgi:hypothetical protein